MKLCLKKPKDVKSKLLAKEQKEVRRIITGQRVKKKILGHAANCSSQ